jgi:hypothetical protein
VLKHEKGKIITLQLINKQKKQSQVSKNNLAVTRTYNQNNNNSSERKSQVRATANGKARMSPL